MRFPSTIFLACLWAGIGGLQSAPAQAARAPGVILLVPLQGAAGSDFDSSVNRLILRPLANEADVLPLNAYATVSASLKVKVTDGAMHSAGTVRQVGRAAGATHVLVIEALGPRAHLALNISLTAVAGGQRLLSERRPLAAGHLTAGLAQEVRELVLTRLRNKRGATAPPHLAALPPATHGAAAPLPAPPVAAPRKAVAAPPLPAALVAPVPTGAVPAPIGVGAKAPDRAPVLASSPQSAPPPAINVPTTPHVAPVAAAAPPPPLPSTRPRHVPILARTPKVEPVPAVAPPATAVAGKPGRPALRIAVGPGLMQRVGTLRQAGRDVASFAAAAGKNNPVFPAANLNVEVYLGTLAAAQPALQDLGLEARLLLTGVQSYYLPNAPQKLTTSTLVGWHLGAIYRHRFNAGGDWQPLIRLGLGYGAFSFPLPADGPFPGVTYLAPEVAARIILPLALPLHLAALLGANLRPALHVGGNAGRALGSSQTSGFGYLLEAGLRAQLPLLPLQLELLFNYVHQSANFAGTAGLPGFNRPLSDLQLRDRQLQLMLSLAWII